MKHSNPPIKKIIAASFGDTMDDRTYSGVPRHVFKSLEKYIPEIIYLNTKQLSVSDLFDGMFDVAQFFRTRKLCLSPRWIWKEKTVEKLSRRFEKQLEKHPDSDCIVQMGTHVYNSQSKMDSYCRTDMTIAQGVEAGAFNMNVLTAQEVDEAIEMQRRIFESCKGIFVASHWSKESVIRDYGIEKERIHVIGVGASVPVSIDLDKKQNNHKILFIGRDFKRKGGELLLGAFKFVRKAVPDAELKIIGCNPKIPSRSGVEILGYLDKRKPRDKQVFIRTLQECSVLCVPSVFEPLGICFIEAQYCGLVPVTFFGQGRSDAIQHEKSGYLVQGSSEHDMAEALIELFRKPDKLRQMREYGYQYVNNHFTWDHVSRRIYSVLESSRSHADAP